MQPTVLDIITEVIEEVSIEMLPKLKTLNDKYTGVRFDYGHPAEIVGKIAQLSTTEANRFKAYPLIGLFLDFPESRGRAINIETSARLNLFICVQTQAKYTPQQRTEQSFRPILIPIYDELIRQLGRHKLILNPEDLIFKHDYTARYQWGKGGLEYYNNGVKNAFNDFIDAIEITNLKLDFSPYC